MKSKYLLFFCFINVAFFSFAQNVPADPKMPNVAGSSSSVNKSAKVRSVVCTNESGATVTGECSSLSNFYITNLIYDDNSDGKQSISIDYVKSITIKGYTMTKRTTDNLSIVYYFPYIFDIVLTNGKIILDAVGKIPEINTFDIAKMRNNQKCYTYFVRYWLEDKGEFANNGSKNYNEKPTVPPATITKIDFNN